MSKQSTKTRPAGWEDQHGSAGASSHNPSDQDYQQKFNDIVGAEKQLSDLEKSWNASYEGKNSTNNATTHSLHENETNPASVPNTPSILTSQERTGGRFGRNTIRQIFTGKNLRRNSSLTAILLLLFGGGGFLTIFFSPSLAIINMKEVFTRSLNDQLHALDERSSVAIRSKLKETTKGSCGAIKIKCRFATISLAQVEKYKSNGIDMELDMEKGFGDTRGRIVKISYMDDNGVTTVTDAAELQRELINNERFRSAMIKVHNPMFMGFTDKIAMMTYGKHKVSKSLVATGNSDEERQKNINDSVSGIENGNVKTIIKTTDADGKEIYTDNSGNHYSAEEVKTLQEQAERSEKNLKNGGSKAILTGAIKGVNIIGAADSACTVYNSARYVSALSKTVKQTQAIRFAMAMILTPADSIKAGDATPDDVTFIGNKLTETRPSGKVLDESKLDEPNSANQPAVIDDPDAGKNALNSPGYELAAYNTVPDINLRASRFMLAGGSVALLDKIIVNIAKIVNGGNPNPKAIGQKCRYIQNPAVRFGGLAVGIIAGVGSFGLLTAASIAGSTAIALALPFLETQAAEMLAGNMFQDLSDVDIGDAGYVGSAGLFGSIAQSRGMMPLDKQDATEYLAANQQSYAKYEENERYLARATPFDINNRFSFMGSLAYTLTPMLQQSKASVGTAMMGILNLVPTSFGSLIKTTRALPADYFDHCNEPTYKELGIVAGPFCELRYGLDKQDLGMDMLANAEWMVTSGNLENTEEAAPVDNGQPWNYVKFLDECVNRRVGFGEDQGENTGDGSNCFKPEFEDLNRHFRVYTVDRSINDYMDNNVSPVQETDYDDGQTGDVDARGWAFPTVASNEIVRGFRTNLDPNHMGVAIAAATDSETKGQPIYAAYEGTVIAAGPSADYGNWVVIEHHIDGKAMTTVYGRMNNDGVIRFEPGVTKVKAGQLIGHIGSANQSDQKPYLYFELWSGSALGNGVRIDPQPYIDAARKKQEATNV